MYEVLNILIDANDKTVGAKVFDGKKVLNISTNKLMELANRKTFEGFVNAVVGKNGYVRSKRGYPALTKVYLQTNKMAEYSTEIARVEELLKLNPLILYHGTKEVDLHPQFGKGRKNNDYGRGFYTTPDLELAKEWAYAGYSGQGQGYVYAYALDCTGLKILNFCELDSIHWIAELISHRRLNFGTDSGLSAWQDDANLLIQKYGLDTSGYDIIIGYHADDSYFSYAEAFVKGGLYKENLDKALRLGNLGLQVFIKSKRAFSLLKEISCEGVPAKYENYFKSRDKAARDAFMRIQAEDKSQLISKRGVYKRISYYLDKK